MKKGFRQRPSSKPVEVSIDIKNATAGNIGAAQAAVADASQKLALANHNLDTLLRSILTENGIAEARPIKVTDTKPRRLVVEVLKYAKPE